VAIQGIGGLGHLGIQFARQMGFRTIAIGRGADKESMVKKLGAHQYIDAGAGNPAEPLQKLGGARLIMVTAPDAKSIPLLIEGLAKGGELLVLGVSPEPFSVASAAIVIGRRNVQGWPSGTAKDSEDTLQFSSMTGVRPMIEKFPLEKAAEAYNKMMTGQVRFRAVLTMAG
jgi:propanol-preferring alcohol dehydrogenase